MKGLPLFLLGGVTTSAEDDCDSDATGAEHVFGGRPLLFFGGGGVGDGVGGGGVRTTDGEFPGLLLVGGDRAGAGVSGAGIDLGGLPGFLVRVGATGMGGDVKDKYSDEFAAAMIVDEAN